MQNFDILPCTENVDAAVIAEARRILQRYVPVNFQLIDVRPIYVLGVNPHRWRATYHHAQNVYDTTCGVVRRATNNFNARCPPGCTIKNVAIEPVPNDEVYSVDFIVRCECHRPNHRRRRHQSNDKCNPYCKGLVDNPAPGRKSSDPLPCPRNANLTVIENARRIIEKHSPPPGYTLEDIRPAYIHGSNFLRWRCTFIRDDGHYENGCTFLHEEVRLPFRNYCPELSDVDKEIAAEHQLSHDF